ncbi:2-dehydro-3-deoxygalactonokinase [Novosphingobium sp. Gsoil 351]|uniref:2-dehydro-3-deoxygalactonokinase n=1 Tax=Novosphingobium sp. Gsoil 351 TaxID=2675225 RepID=UPI0012B45A55|nr:2-dehydro-3-deoxygalactonokinase [Novosphingobium sp. Gsoil 351]QGN54154.1 2-dehydro-3-deoxygalactonokinase [Novosphingobium sp. Gsoil 351]
MIVGDWGTTRLRMFRSARADADKLVGPGIGQLRASPSQTLAAMLEPWTEPALESGVLLCGMAGSRNGLIDLGYVECPVGFDDWSAQVGIVEGFAYPVRVATGLKGANFAYLPDVMRGEETQVFGAMVIEPRLACGEHVMVLPGTHSKWVVTAGGTIRSFHTFPTGELFALLRDHSTLVRAGADPGDVDAGFEAGVTQGLRHSLAGLFAARAAQLVDGRTHGWGLGFLSGLLIGGELGEARALIGEAATTLTVIGDPSLSALYLQAGKQLGLTMTLYDGDACVIAGLGRLAKICEEQAK